MRIIGGIHRGRALLAPPDLTIRPTADRTRESLFNVLMHGNFPIEPIIDQAVIDICCGTGALGLEAISRGASHCTFIDHSRAALELAEDNAAKLGETSKCRFVLADAAKLPAGSSPVSLVMLDAPYRSGMAMSVLGRLKSGGWLRPGTVIAIEQDKKETPPEMDGFTLHNMRQYGKAHITIMIANVA